MFGISLRLSAASVNALAGSPDKRAELKAYLSDNDMCLYTVNAFPYGPFKNIIVKEQFMNLTGAQKSGFNIR